MSHTVLNATPSAAEIIRTQIDLRPLTAGNIVLIGLGGIGAIFAQQMLVFLAGLDEQFRVVMVDGDAYAPSNRYRVAVPDYDNKAVAQAVYLNDLVGRPGLQIRPFSAHLTEANRHEVIGEGDFVCLAVDNHATRRTASRRLGELANGYLISAGNDGVGPGQRGTYGNVQVYGRIDGRDAVGSPLDRYHPEIAQPADKNPTELDCMELAVAGVPQVLFANQMAAALMGAAVWRLIAPPEGERMYDEICFDVTEAVAKPRWLSGPRRACS